MTSDATGATATAFLRSDLPAYGLTRAVRTLARHRLWVSIAGLVITLVLGVGYLTFGVFATNADGETITVRVHLTESGGLLPRQNVTLRGVPIGTVRAVDITGDGVVAVATIDASVPIPGNGEVRVAGLSFAGEQYLDFRPDSEHGPYLTDGQEISAERTTTPLPLATLMQDMNGMLAQIDPGRLRTISRELGMGAAGPEKLRDIVDGGTFLISTLDSVMPETVSLLRSSRTVLTTLGDGREALTDIARSGDRLMTGAQRSAGGYGRLLARTPALLAGVDTVIADNAPTMVQLLGNLLTVTQLTYLRIPALREFFFPTERAGSTLGALNSTIHDGGIWAAVNIYPRYTCDYDLPRLPTSRPDSPEPYLYTYCANHDPSVLIRGARNAPRPPGDDTAGPPPGVRPDARSTPAPKGPHSIPLPFGGPALPTAPR